MIKRYEAVCKLKNKYDYLEFILKCKELNIVQLNWVEYATKIATLDYAMAIYPEMDPLDAYLQTIKDNGNSLGIPLYKAVKLPESPCNGCGGGKVR